MNDLPKISVKGWELIGQLVGTRANLQDLKKQRTQQRKLWSTYKYHNHNQTWYSEFIYKAGIDIKNANLYADELGHQYHVLITPRDALEDSNMEPPYARGVTIYRRLQNMILDIKDLQARISNICQELWDQGIPLKEIAKAYGASENTTYLYLSRQRWFESRRGHTESPLVDNINQ